MVLKKENFQYLDLPDLLLNIWAYGDASPGNEIVKKYLQWCIDFAEKKWKNILIFKTPSKKHIFVKNNFLTSDNFHLKQDI